MTKRTFENFYKIYNNTNGDSYLYPQHARDIVENGFYLEEQKPDENFPYGWFIVFRGFDDKQIGRIHYDGKCWNSRFWFFGGGTTYGNFPTQWMAAMWALAKNSVLQNGWDDV